MTEINQRAIEKIEEALKAYESRPLINEPLYINPRTYRDYDLYRWECGRAIGWNQAMDFIFGEREGNEGKRVKSIDIGFGVQTGAGR